MSTDRPKSAVGKKSRMGLFSRIGRIMPSNSSAAEIMESRASDSDESTISKDSETDSYRFRVDHPNCPDKLRLFKLERVIGKGSFAKVLLVRHRDSDKIYAMKIMNKQHILDKRQVDNVLHERTIMAEIDHPYIGKLRTAFQTAKKLFMVLEFCPGGELYFHMTKEKKFSEEITRFYIAEIALALAFLHSRTILFRDLKAENILMDAEGHLKLSDFGMARRGITSWLSGAHTMCGTPQYMAPEVFLTDNYGLGADWWGLGILGYEMIAGVPPFRGKSAKEVFANTAKKPLVLLRSWSTDLKSFLRGMLSKRPDSRLGCTNGSMEILSHAFLRAIDLPALENRELRAPYRPNAPKLDARSLSTSSAMGGGGSSRPNTAPSSHNEMSMDVVDDNLGTGLNIDERRLGAAAAQSNFDSIYNSDLNGGAGAGGGGGGDGGGGEGKQGGDGGAPFGRQDQPRTLSQHQDEYNINEFTFEPDEGTFRKQKR